jgi:hypothetical protein
MNARRFTSLGVRDVLAGARLLRTLPGFLRHPVSLEEAQATLSRRLERRGADFVEFARTTIYASPASPYRWLLMRAGCEAGDLEQLVARDGVEGALTLLCRRGVYLTVEEFKARRPVIRGSATLELHPNQLLNPLVSAQLPAQTGGSSGASSVVPIDLASLRDRCVDRRLQVEARGAGRWVHAIWGIPGGQAMGNILDFAGIGSPPARWFASVDPGAPGLAARYRWSARLLIWGSLVAGVPLPAPEYVPADDALRIARWIARVLEGGETPHVSLYVSAGVRLCLAAREAGLELCGAKFTVGGEPLTETKLEVFRSAGVEALPGYSTIEAGRIGFGCVAPEVPDDYHLLHDLVALVQPGVDGEQRGLRSSALLVSSLRLTAPVVMLNVSLGDQAVLAERTCGCPLEQVGWSTHLHTVRSFEKLTLGGMTFLDRDVIRVLEEVLPRRFGGGRTDYQLVEMENETGRSKLVLLAHPDIGPLEADAVAEAFLQAIGAGSGAEHVMELEWRQAGVLGVERRPPYLTPAGKILHLYQVRPHTS